VVAGGGDFHNVKSDYRDAVHARMMLASSLVEKRDSAYRSIGSLATRCRLRRGLHDCSCVSSGRSAPVIDARTRNL
jgi:hypothetical protein